MKNQFLKRTLAAAIGTAMLLGSVPGFAAVTETQVFKDDFEILSGNRALAVGIPELKVYGKDIMNGDGTFENITAAGSVNSMGLNFTTNAYAYAQTSGGRNNTKYVWVTAKLNGSNDGTFTYKFPVGTEFKKGVYELSAWVKGFVHESVPTSADKTVYLSWNGNYNKWTAQNISHMASRFGSTELSLSEWREIKCYIPFSADYTVASDSQPTFSLSMEQYASGDKETRRFLVDDITMRKIENCDLVGRKDINPGTELTQNNVPYYKLSLASGKTATLTYPVENQTDAPVDATVLCALYDKEGALVDVLGCKKETVAANAQAVITDEIEIPAGIDDTYKMKYFLWKNLDTVYPYASKKDSTDIGFISDRNQVIPNTSGWQITSAKNRYNDQQNAAESMIRVVSGVSKSGVNSLYIPYPLTNGTESGLSESGSAAYVMTDTLEGSTTYRLKFYAKPVCVTNDDALAVGVAKGDMRNLRNTSAWLDLKLVYTDENGVEKKAENNDVTIGGIRYIHNAGHGASKITRIYSNVPKEWKEYTFEFTTTDAGNYSLDFQTSYNGSFYKGKFGGIYIDDVRVYNVTDSGESAE